jgi:hypothetical protein
MIQVQILKALLRQLTEQNVRFIVIGGMAMVKHGVCGHDLGYCLPVANEVRLRWSGG